MSAPVVLDEMKDGVDNAIGTVEAGDFTVTEKTTLPIRRRAASGSALASLSYMPQRNPLSPIYAAVGRGTGDITSGLEYDLVGSDSEKRVKLVEDELDREEFDGGIPVSIHANSNNGGGGGERTGVAGGRIESTRQLGHEPISHLSGSDLFFDMSVDMNH